ncbi:fungal-specific transcription factor domain-containing protein [Massariosphaeria phaeospora]|uniref:Fungal-specific transcription factor domain-containing protein n=1 Tax=Massariosphaeria phaeospora TaxID=100035 RepID=A0A7C8M1Z3_9PLEO|nr:fungal-specific transcription factor domain-containing protein [Massariosphaeria phaeospora]
MGSTDISLLPTRACHNCRKRRWKCDKSLPVCHKCLSAGTECLGYGKLFVWNHGVASRGKMMGKSFSEVTSMPVSKKEGQAQCDVVRDGSKAVQKRVGEPENVDKELDDTPQDTIDPPRPEAQPLTLHRPLTDPLLKDLTPNSRYYLFHFATQLCADMVTYDGPGQNPIRDLIPATSAHPLLLQIIVANSAFHVFNISRDPMSQSAYQQSQKPCLVAYYQAVSRFGGDGPLKSSYHDALIAKQHALSLLARGVAAVNVENIDLILVSILLFINYDLIESGKDKWKVHMEGARKLIDLLGTPAFMQHPMSKLRQCILSDFLVFSILGSTFTFSSSPRLIPSSIDLSPILAYAETNNYLSCPSPLLRIMLESFSLPCKPTPSSSDISAEVQKQVATLLQAALLFDPIEWSLNFQPASPFEDLEQRVRIASAHRSAVCIYLARVLPCNNPLLDAGSGSALVSLTGLAEDIVHHISYIQPGDTMFKSISWPLFLAGAECEDPAQREWIMNTLDAFYDVMYWGYINTVKKVLEAIWNCKAKAAAGADNCWVDDVKEMGTEILIA